MSETVGALRGVLRPMLDEDIAGVRAIVEEGDFLAEYHPYVYWVMRRNAPDLCHVYAQDNEIFGYIAGVAPFLNQHTCLLWQIGVRRDVRRQGAANALAETFLAKAARNGFSEVQLTIDASNQASRSFFRDLAQNSRAIVGIKSFGETEGPDFREERLALHLAPRK